MEVATSEQHVSEAIYDCVICGQSGPSTEDRPTGLVVLLQASSGMKMWLAGRAVFLELLICVRCFMEPGKTVTSSCEWSFMRHACRSKGYLENVSMFGRRANSLIPSYFLLAFASLAVYNRHAGKQVLKEKEGNVTISASICMCMCSCVYIYFTNECKSTNSSI